MVMKTFLNRWVELYVNIRGGLHYNDDINLLCFQKFYRRNYLTHRKNAVNRVHCNKKRR